MRVEGARHRDLLGTATRPENLLNRRIDDIVNPVGVRSTSRTPVTNSFEPATRRAHHTIPGEPSCHHEVINSTVVHGLEHVRKPQCRPSSSVGGIAHLKGEGPLSLALSIDEKPIDMPGDLGIRHREGVLVLQDFLGQIADLHQVTLQRPHVVLP